MIHLENRPAALAAVYRSLGSRPKRNYAQYTADLIDWEAIPVWDDGEVIGAVLRQGSVLHLGIERAPRGSQRKLIRDVLVPTLRQHGMVSTAVCADHPTGIDFCRRLGFKEDGVENGVIYMTCRQTRYA